MSKQDEQQDKKKKKEPMDGEKRFYLLTAIGCAVALTAIIAVAVIFTGDNHTATGMLDNNQQQEQPTDKEENKDVVVTPDGFVMPVESVSIGGEYGFYYNQSVNAYYGHKGLDFTAAAGTDVYCVESGSVESITRDELLTGTEIVINHGDGVKSVYRFVDAVDGLQVGAKVSKGQKIATVAEACGSEYKDGAHLHLEIVENGKLVDPNLYLTLEEK